jgi:threonine synthase
VPRYLQSGRWLPHATQATLSNAMDVGNPNNWPRIQHLLDTGLITAADLSAVAVSEADTVQAVHDLDALGYLSEPHAAVACKALQDSLQDGEYGVFLGTAHPAKFKESVESILGRGIAVPPALHEAGLRPSLNGRITADYTALQAQLLALA